MSKVFLLLFMLISTFILSGQDRQKIDSLKSVLVNQKEDTLKLFTLTDLTYEFIFTKPDSALIIGEQGLQLARKLGHKKGEKSLNFPMTAACMVKGNYYRGIQIMLENRQLCEEINDPLGVSYSFNFLGILYKDMGDYSRGLQYVLRGKEIDDSMGVIRWDTYKNIGTIYEKMDQLDSALKYILKSYELELIENKGNHPYPPYVLGNIHAKLHNYELAMAYYHNSLSRALKNNIFKDVIDNYNGIIRVFAEIKKPDSVIYYSKEALKYHAIVSYVKGAQEAAAILAKTYKLEGNVDSSLKYFELSAILKDSLYSQEKIIQVQNLAFTEQQRQKAIDEIKTKEEEQRRHNLQYALIGIGLISFIILFFLLSHSIIVRTGLIKFFGIIGLLLVFEFINLFIHPYLVKITNHSPLWMLLILVSIAALLVPLHHRLEKWITNKLVEKNKRIRLAAAKRTIATLEGNDENEN